MSPDLQAGYPLFWMEARLMRARFPVWLAAAAVVVALPPQAGAQDAFEGVITFQTSFSERGPQSMTYSVKGNNARMDVSMEGMNMFTLYDKTANTMDMVIPDRKMYMERSMANMSPFSDSVAANSKLTWTGNKETIAGYECEHATVTEKDGSAADICLANGLGSFMLLNGGMGARGRGDAPDWTETVGKMFPLKVTQDGKVQLEVTSIQKKSLDAALFKVPDGFMKMSMPGGGGGDTR